MELFKREQYLNRIRGFYHAPDIIKVITGVRRCGKSTLMQLVSEELLASGVERQRIVFLNLDLREYRKIRTADQLDELIAGFPAEKGLNYLFIDEVQNVSGFEDVLNAWREDGQWSIFITGSNSYLLSGELATKLTGRYLEIEMFPLTFEEYLGMKAFYRKPVDANLSIELNRYILEGGFPRAVLLDELSDKRSYTQSVVSEIFEKDIRRRVKIKNREAFDAVRHFIVNNFGATMSVSSLHEALVKNGIIKRAEDEEDSIPQRGAQAKSQPMSQPTHEATLPQPEKRRTWIWWVLLVVVASLIGAAIVLLKTRSEKKAETEPQTELVADEQPTAQPTAAAEENPEPQPAARPKRTHEPDAMSLKPEDAKEVSAEITEPE